jgi:4-hydroxybenzoate polyprenyltransferase
MIKFSHSLFALPFALTAMLVAAEGLPELRVMLLIALCMVTARTAAMTFNRIADRHLDAVNPRTAARALPAGRVSLAAAWTLLLISSAGFLVAAALINRATALLGPVALGIVLSYSLAKRVTRMTHFLLGLSLAIAPAGAWLAVRGRLDAPVLALSFAVLAWTAGFDLLYACQDADFDRDAGLESLPARLGVGRSLMIARGCHAAALGGLVVFGMAAARGPAYFLALVVAASLLAWSHAIVREDDLTRVGLAFFQANVGVAAIVLAGTAVDVFR